MWESVSPRNDYRNQRKRAVSEKIKMHQLGWAGGVAVSVAAVYVGYRLLVTSSEFEHTHQEEHSRCGDNCVQR